MLIRSVKANFRRLRNRKMRPIRLPFPVSQTLRVAQLSSGPKFEGVEAFIVERWDDVRPFAANVVIGSASELQRLGEESASGELDTSSIDHALVVITRYGAKPLTDLLRVTLWQALGVPIFELYLGLDDALLAAECEAHEGWHLAHGVEFALFNDRELVLDGAGNNGLHTGLSAMADPQPCPCGRPTARLLEIEQMVMDERYLAASA
jgi:hypothetical protein